MRQSVMSIIFAAALLFECYALTVAIPMIKTEDSSLEEDTFGSLLSKEAAENSLGGTDPAVVSNGPKVIVLADASLWKDLRALYKGLSLHKQRAGENGLILDRRDVGPDQSVAIIRRDTMRCMVGRVYRPCWEV
ncbi:pro-melanin-concentrating hormone, like [Centroberyx affinis]|uniref:pro-melanin-concentrating hormone, like n=1 Tax=Centroberyx affinis TaxID=166261 RepID=UPI003A5BFD78